MSIRSTLLLTLVLSLFGARSAEAVQRVLTRAVEPEFIEFIQNVEAGRYEPGLKTADVSIDGSTVTIVLTRQDGGTKTLLLQRQSASPAVAHTKYFDVEPLAGASPEDVTRLATTLDVLFQRDPWSVSLPSLILRSPAGAPRKVVVRPLSQSSLKDIVLDRIVPAAAADVRVGYVVGLMSLIGLAVLAGLVVLWRTPVPPTARE